MRARFRALATAGLVATTVWAGSPGPSAAAPEEARPASVADDRKAVAPLEFPTRASTGVPRGWQPRRTVEGDLVVRKAGAVVRDLRVMGDLVISAPDVTVLRVEVLGGSIDNWAGSTCHTGLRIRRSTVARAPGQVTSGDFPAIQAGGYHASRVRIDGLPEGFRVGGKDECGAVVIRKSYARVVSPDECGDWHGDGVQGYDGGRLTVRDSRLDLVEAPGCGGTAPFFYPSGQGNTAVDIDGLIVQGGGYAFRLGTSGRVVDLNIVQGSYYYGPLSVLCSAISEWQADIVTLDERGQPRRVRQQRCNSNDGS